MVYLFFKNYIPIVLISILVLGIVFFLKPVILFNNLPKQAINDNFPFYRIFKNILNSNYLVLILLGLVLILFQAYYIVRINLKYFFIEKRTYLPAFFYLIFSSAAIYLTGFHPSIIGVLFFLFIIDKTLDVSVKKDKLFTYYDIGLLLATGSLFYGNLIYFLLFILVALFIVNSINLRKAVIIILGALTIYFIIGFYYYYTDDLSTANEILKNYYFVKIVATEIHYSLIILGAYLAFVIIVAFINQIFRLNLKKIIAMKYINVFNVLFLFLIVYYLLIPGFSYEIIYFALIPVSFLLADFFIHLRSRLIGEIFFSILIALVIFVIIVYPL